MGFLAKLDEIPVQSKAVPPAHLHVGSVVEMLCVHQQSVKIKEVKLVIQDRRHVLLFVMPMTGLEPALYC